ncbi:helix-turn-helix domain-containing protein [Zoogloea sp. LCSB751]|uniref:helix-turn-helix domain-containing protein n=1 Tax=Zoogloea sp. LCSB751 TaxID=1965277 RepID=UPI0013748083|nr:helix-turn-helix transcriptional regulator [Zoogloea sp. LCSB751]
MKIGLRIKATRELRGLSQGELARRIGVSQPAASDWENCRSEPTVENLRALAVELDLWFEWLVTGRGTRDYDPNQPQPPEFRTAPPLPADERDLQAAYRKLTPARREALLDFLKRWG